MRTRRLLRDPRKIFFGWWMVIAGGVIALWGYAYSAYGISALFKPISEELGFSRAKMSVAASITSFEGGLEAMVVGYLSDRYGPRMAVLFGVLMAGIGLMLMRQINSLWSYYLVWSVLFSTGTNISLSMPLDVAIANWFVRYRGTALSIKTGFSGLSGVIGLPMVAWLIVRYGWRMACFIGGAVLLGVGLPLAWIFIRSGRPEAYGMLPDGAAPQTASGADLEQVSRDYVSGTGEADFTVKQALKTRAFWLLVAVNMFHGSLASVMNIHAVPFLTDRGMDPVAAAAMMSLYISASIPARFLGGFISDRMSIGRVRYVVVASYALQAAGVALFLLNPRDTAVLYIFFVLYGVGMGAAMPMASVIRARYFGRRSFGSISGVSRIMQVPVGVVGPVAAGWIYDTTGSYQVAFLIFAVALAASSVVMVLAGPPRRAREPASSGYEAAAP